MSYMHIDNLYKNQDILLFKECYAMEKIHGTSAHISWKHSKLNFFAGGVSYEGFVKLFLPEDLIASFEELNYNDITIFGEGYLVVAEVQKGAVKQYRIENPTDGRVINIPNKIEYEYVKGLVEAKKAEGKASPDEFTKQGNKNIYDAIRELSRGEQQAAWTEGVSKGDTLKIGGKSYTVQSNSDKLLRLKREDGKIFSFKKYGKSRTFAADGKEADLFRKVEGDLTRDLLAQYNQFHTPSDVFNLTRRVIEARNNPMYGKPEVKAAAKSEVKSGELIPTQPEDEKVYFFEPLEKEISVEDMQKIVDANEKVIKELRDVCNSNN